MRSILLMAAALSMLAAPALAEVGKRYPSEKRIIADATTGRPLTLLTSGAVGDAKIYPTHPQWAHDGVNIIFRSGERAGSPQIFAVNEQTGDIVQLTDGPGVDIGSINVARLSNRVFYLRKGESSTLQSIDLTALLAKAAGADHERIHGQLAHLPPEIAVIAIGGPAIIELLEIGVLGRGLLVDLLAHLEGGLHEILGERSQLCALRCHQAT